MDASVASCVVSVVSGLFWAAFILGRFPYDNFHEANSHWPIKPLFHKGPPSLVIHDSGLSGKPKCVCFRARPFTSAAYSLDNRTAGSDGPGLRELVAVVERLGELWQLHGGIFLRIVEDHSFGCQ